MLVPERVDQFRSMYARYGFDNEAVPVYLFPRFVAEIKKNEDFWITPNILETELYMKDLSIMHALLQYASNVGSYMCLLHTLPATKMDLEDMTSFDDFRASLPRHEAKVLFNYNLENHFKSTIKGVRFYKWLRFYMHYFHPSFPVISLKMMSGLYDQTKGKFEISDRPIERFYRHYDRQSDQEREGEWWRFIEQLREAGITDELITTQFDGAIRDQYERLVETYEGMGAGNFADIGRKSRAI